MDYKKSLYNCAIANQGYLLAGIPQRPARKMGVASPVGIFPTQVDLEYKDASSFLPFVQTDWSGGFQEKKWTDNATFKNGSGLEYIAKYGQLTLLNNKSATVKDFGADHTFGSALIYNQTLLIGTKHGTTAILGYLKSDDTWTAITVDADITQVNDMDELGGKAYLALKRKAGTQKCLKSWDGSALADATGDAADTTEWRIVKRIETRLYASNFNSAVNGDRLLYSDNNGTNWKVLITATGVNRQITKGVENIGTLYFLIEDFPRCELWWVNDTIITQIYRWENLTNPQISSWLGVVYVEGKEDGKLRRFAWNGAVMKCIFEERISGLDVDTSPMLVYKENLHSYGLVFDRKFCFPSWVFKYGSNKIYPFVVFGGTASQVPYFYGLDGTSLKITKLKTDAYLTSGNVVSGTFTGGKPGVDKLWFSITLSFKALVSGQSIKAYYSTDDEANWTLIGTADIVGDKEKTFYFASNTISKRTQLKLELLGGGTNTPTLYDFIVRFLPLPDDRFNWSLVLNCSDNLILLDGKTCEPKTGIELRNVLRLAEFNKTIVELQDVDFAETQLNGALTATADTITVDSTNKFPEQGRIKIEQEETFYTGKTATTFTGCTRGARGTKSASHADNIRVHNAYNVIITNVAEQLFVAPKPQAIESAVQVSLLET